MATPGDSGIRSSCSPLHPGAVRRFKWGDGGEEWLRFTLDPPALSCFRFPDRVTIKAASAAVAFGVTRDELDVEHIIRFPF